MKILFLFILSSAFALSQTNHIIEVSNYVLNPQDITISLKDTVEWICIEGTCKISSDSTSGPNSWEVSLKRNKTYKIILNTTGVHRYSCKSHKDVTNGSITVLAPTPVELTLFTVDLIDNNTLLRWVTATETNNYGFEIQRMKPDDDINPGWQKINFIIGNGTTAKVSHYSYTDNILSSGEYRYRLRQIDFDGTFTYSKIVSINYLTNKRFSLDQNYPNPFNPNTIINFSLPADGLVTLKLFDALGREVETLLNEFRTAGSYEVKINSNSIKGGLQSGIYYYNLTSANISSTRKMIILK